MECGEKSLGGEIFVLKMPVIKLKDLAEVVVEEACKKYGVDIKEVKIHTIGESYDSKEEIAIDKERIREYIVCKNLI